MSVKYKYRAVNDDSCNFSVSRFKEIKKIQFLFISAQIALIPIIL